MSAKEITYTEVVRALESRGIMPDGPPSLRPMIQGLERILASSKIDPKKVIVVAGTNGKGSVCATLEALLIAAGQTVGLYTSPHLEETTERIRLNGQDISRDDFCEAYQWIAKRTVDLHLSHFEVLTLMAAWIFLSGEHSPPVNWAIFEVGLGGTWDATNAIPHHHCVITTLGYDHQNILGNSLEEIASNKFGIVSRGTTVVHSPLPSEVQSLAERIRFDTQSRWIESMAASWRVDHERREPAFFIQTPWGEAPLSLSGQRAVQNTATALTLFQELGFHPAEHLSALSQVRWPGRMEKYELRKCPCPVYLSGDHNPEGIKSLIDLLNYYPRKHLYILLGIVKDKDSDGIISPLLSLPDSSLFLTEVAFRKRSLEDYGKWLNLAQGAWRDPAEALEKLISLVRADDLILVTGSLYLVGQIKKWIAQANQSDADA